MMPIPQAWCWLPVVPMSALSQAQRRYLPAYGSNCRSEFAYAKSRCKTGAPASIG